MSELNRKEVVITAKSVEQAVEIGANELEMPKEDVLFEVLELPKKGFLGLGTSDAKVKVYVEYVEVVKSNKETEKKALDIATGFLEKIIRHMKLDAEVKIINETEKEIKLEIIGKGLGALIGYHGEILDNLQYLTYLAVNRGDSSGDDEEKLKDSIRISIDIENYRAKREETLKGVAKRMAERVLKYGRSVTLEPMNAYERRVIHATVQDIDGLTTYSVGQDSERKVVISTGKGNRDKPSFQRNRGGNGNRNGTGVREGRDITQGDS